MAGVICIPNELELGNTFEFETTTGDAVFPTLYVSFEQLIGKSLGLWLADFDHRSSIRLCGNGWILRIVATEPTLEMRCSRGDAGLNRRISAVPDTSPQDNRKGRLYAVALDVILG
ncbi:MAG: hypothetical protein R3D85_03960 [Paracoccaceae bacterium]